MRRRQPTSQRRLVTVLFTDIVGSTETAAALGDRRWKPLIAKHDATVRKELKRFRGREMDTAGDGFFAAFEQPADAILCATAAAERLRAFGVEIRAGIHIGQVETDGPKVQGLAVNIGARVAAKAGAGEILVSSTVRDALAGSDIAFADHGVAELKGIPGEWRLFTVVKDDKLIHDSVGGERVLAETSSDEREPRSARISRAWVLGIALVVLVGLVSGSVILLSKDGTSYVPIADSVAKLDAAGSVIGGSVVGGSPTVIAYGSGGLWVGNYGDQTLQRIDPDTGAADPALGLPGRPSGIAVGAGSVWITSSITGQLFQFVIESGVRHDFDLSTGVQGVAFGDGAVWVASSDQDAVLRIDPADPSRVQTIPLPQGSAPGGITVGGGGVWVSETLGHQVARVDPRTLDVLTTVQLLNGQPDAITFGGGYVWVASFTADSVTRIDPADNSHITIENVGNGPHGIAADGAAVWVANGLDGTVVRIAPAGHIVGQPTQLGFAPGGVTLAGDSVWVTLSAV